MKWLYLLLAVACAGPKFQEDNFYALPSDDGGPTDTDADAATPTAGRAADLSAGDGGAPGTVAPHAGQGGTDQDGGNAGQPGDTSLDCSQVAYWTVNCMYEEPQSYFQWGGQLYRSLQPLNDCSGSCPPEGLSREPYCDAGKYVYEHLGPC